MRDLKDAVLSATFNAAKYLSVMLKALQAVMVASTPDAIADEVSTDPQLAQLDRSKRLAEASKKLDKVSQLLFTVQSEVAGSAYLLGVRVPQECTIFVRSPRDAREWKKLVHLCNAETKVTAHALYAMEKEFRTLPGSADQLDLLQGALQGSEISRLHQLGALAGTCTRSLQKLLGFAVAAGAASKHAPWVLKLTDRQATLASRVAQTLAELVRAVKTTADNAITNVSSTSWSLSPSSPERALARNNQLAIRLPDTQLNKPLNDAAAKISAVHKEILDIASFTSFVDVSTPRAHVTSGRRPKYAAEWKSAIHQINGEVASAVRELRNLDPLLKAASPESEVDYLETSKDEQARVIAQLGMLARPVAASLESLLSMVVPLGAHARFAPWMDTTARSDASSESSSDRQGGSMRLISTPDGSKLSAGVEEADDAPKGEFSKDAPASQRGSTRRKTAFDEGMKTGVEGMTKRLSLLSQQSSLKQLPGLHKQNRPSLLPQQSSLKQLPGLHPKKSQSQKMSDSPPASPEPTAVLSSKGKQQGLFKGKQPKKLGSRGEKLPPPKDVTQQL